MGMTILLGLFAIGIVIGMPVAIALGIAALAAFFVEGLPTLIAFQRIGSGISTFSLLAIPFFIFAGELMLHGGIANRLVQFATALVGSRRGGLGIVNVFSSMLFGGISGSAVADTSALGSILIPVMKKEGYRADYAVNVTVVLYRRHHCWRSFKRCFHRYGIRCHRGGLCVDHYRFCLS